MFRELTIRVRKHSTEKPIRTPDDAIVFLRKEFGDRLTEHFIAIHLDGRHRVTEYSVISQGTQTSSLVHPREVFCAAIREAACAVIVAHNHPSGDPTPSAEDRAVTKRLARCGEILGVKLLDHIIIGDGAPYSFREANPDFLDGQEG